MKREDLNKLYELLSDLLWETDDKDTKKVDSVRIIVLDKLDNIDDE